jgi:hypothetical protein
MHLDDLDIPIGIERLRHLLDQQHGQIDAEAHIGRQHDRRAPGCRFDGGTVGSLEAGRADHMGVAMLGGEAGMGHRCGRRGEIEHSVGGCKERVGIIRERDPDGLDPGESPQILAQRGIARPLRAAGDDAAGRRRNRRQQHAPHAPRCADDTDLHRHVFTTMFPSSAIRQIPMIGTGI